MAEKDVGDNAGGNLVEFHVCDAHDCTILASSLKGTLNQCTKPKMEGDETRPVQNLPTNGLGRLMNTEAPSVSDTEGPLDPPPPHLFTEEDSNSSEKSRQTIRDDVSSKAKERENQSASSVASVSGFFSHYAYVRTCDMLMSMSPPKKLLPSVVDDEAEHLRSQCAGRVRQLVQMFNGLREE
jgi:hypothetical protein